MPFGRRNDTSTERWDVSQQLKLLGMDVTQMDSSELLRELSKHGPIAFGNGSLEANLSADQSGQI